MFYAPTVSLFSALITNTDVCMKTFLPFVHRILDFLNYCLYLNRMENILFTFVISYKPP